MKRPNWTALPPEITLEIFSYHKRDFLFRLAISGVCKEWRDYSRLLETIDFRLWLLNKERCKVHGAYLASCMCAHNSLLRMISRCVALSNLEINESLWDRSLLGNIRVWRYLNHIQNFRTSLEKLCLTLTLTHHKIPLESSGVFWNLLRCERLEYLEIEFTSFRPVELDVQIEEGIVNQSLTYCKLFNLSMTHSAIEWLVQACDALEKLELHIHCHKIEFPELQLHAPQLVTLDISGVVWDDMIVYAPWLDKLHISDEVMELSLPLSTCLRSLHLWGSYLTSVVTPNPTYLEKLTITCVDCYWSFEDVKACLDKYPMLLVLNLNYDWGVYNFERMSIIDLFSSLCRLEKLVVTAELLEILEEEVHEEEVRLYETGGRGKVLETLKAITVRNALGRGTLAIGKFWRLWPNAKLDVPYVEESVMAEIEAEKNKKNEHFRIHE